MVKKWERVRFIKIWRRYDKVEYRNRFLGMYAVLAPNWELRVGRLSKRKAHISGDGGSSRGFGGAKVPWETALIDWGPWGWALV